MHDVLAHTLSALSIQLEGTRLLAEQRSSDPKVVVALDRAGRLAREGLGEARRVSLYECRFRQAKVNCGKIRWSDRGCGRNRCQFGTGTVWRLPSEPQAHCGRDQV